MADKAHILTDKEIEKMERHLSAIYSRAEKELSEKADKYFERFRKRDEKMRELLDAGKIDRKEYDTWRKNQLMTGRHWTEMKRQAAHRLTQADQEAADYINGRLPSVYALNYNAVSDGLETRLKGYSFELVDANTVKNLATQDKTLLPYKYIDGAKAERWHTQRVNAEVLQGILQGESIPKIAKRLRDNVGMSARGSAVRNARTAVTSAENKGRMDMLHDAEEKGVKAEKGWLSSNQPGRTRDAHMPGDFEKLFVPIDEPFVNSLGKIMYPGDPAAAPSNVYNCRCTLVYKVVGFGKGQKDPGKQIADVLGIDANGVNISELPIETQNIIYGKFDKCVKKFPQISGHTISVKYKDDIGEAIAMSKSITGELYVGPKFKDFEKLEKSYEYGVRLKFHVKGTDAASSITHEIGHQIDGLLTRNGIYGGSISQYGVTRTSVAVQKEVLSRLGFDSDYIKKLRAEYQAKGFSGKDLMHAIDFERKEFIEKHLSSYAAENSNEFFAECFAEYMDSDSPRKAAIIFGEILERLMGEL